jgi:hypothetical protein
MVVTLLILLAAKIPGGHFLTRSEFADLFGKVKRGQSMSEVRQILGKPDEVWTADDPYPFGSRTGESWGWGTDGHFSLATRGSIFFNIGKRVEGIRSPLHNGRARVAYIDAGGRNPGQPGYLEHMVEKVGDPYNMFEVHWNESELKSLLRAIDRNVYPGGRFSQASPGILERIRVSNLLIPLGEAKATAALCEYASLAKEEQFLNDVVRCLFTPKARNGFLPSPMIGLLVPEPPSHRALLPAYPVFIDQGIPFEVARVGLLMGKAACLPMDIQEVRKAGKFRGSLLVPTDHPNEALEEAISTLTGSEMGKKGSSSEFASSAWGAWSSDYLNSDFKQLIRTVVDPGHPLGDVPMKWDTSLQMYVRPDGSHLPLAPIAPVHPRIVF